MNLEDPEQSTPLLPTPSEYDHNFPNNNRPVFYLVFNYSSKINFRAELLHKLTFELK